MFAATYICEQTFSFLNLNKNKFRSCLLNKNLENILRTGISNIKPNYIELTNEKNVTFLTVNC